MQGNYVDVHDNEVVNLSIDKATVAVDDAERKQEPTAEDGGSARGKGDEEVNRYPATRALQELLRGEWFGKMRRMPTYDGGWTDSFVEALMGSEHGEEIAREWAKERKRPKIEGHVIGTLMEAGVLVDEPEVIAREAKVMDKARSFAKYIGEGRKQPYAGWVREYVEGEASE